MKQIAVLTGDIVGSTKLRADELAAALNSIKRVAFVAANEWPENGRTAFAMRSGDSWQIATENAKYAIRMALCIRAFIRGGGKHIETKLSLAQGSSNFDFQSDMNEAFDPVFWASGRKLDSMSGKDKFSFSDQNRLDAVCKLLDHISRKWTSAQGDALLQALVPNPPTSEFIAKTLRKSRQAVDQSLHAAGYPAIEAALTLIEESYDTR